MSQPLPDQVIAVGNGFWNIRGVFKVAGINVGTQCSLVKRRSGGYLMLDACTLADATKRWLDELTDGGKALEAVIHLHPFHTVFARRMHSHYPDATLYGTARHARKLGDLPWAELRSEQDELHALFADDLDFSIPRAVDFIPENEKLHFASVLAFHPASKTLHVDDTLTYARLPKLLRFVKQDLMMLHPSLADVLERRAGAAADFRAWTDELVDRCRDVDNLCAAHLATLLGRDNAGPPIAARVEAAVAKVEPKLRAHERRYG